MYTNAIKTVVSIKNPTGQASSKGSSHLQRNSKGSNHPQRNSKGNSHPQASSKGNLNKARATGQCNSRTKTGARELKTITAHNNIEAAVRADQAAPVDPVAAAGVVAAEAAAEEGKQLKSTLFC
jgi:hypothetical protein